MQIGHIQSWVLKDVQNWEPFFWSFSFMDLIFPTCSSPPRSSFCLQFFMNGVTLIIFDPFCSLQLQCDVVLWCFYVCFSGLCLVLLELQNCTWRLASLEPLGVGVTMSRLPFFLSVKDVNPLKWLRLPRISGKGLDWAKVVCEPLGKVGQVHSPRTHAMTSALPIVCQAFRMAMGPSALELCLSARHVARLEPPKGYS